MREILITTCSSVLLASCATSMTNEPPSPAPRAQAEPRDTSPPSPTRDFGDALLQWLLPDSYRAGSCQRLDGVDVTEFHREYDPEGRLIRQDVLGGLPTQTTLFRYDERGPISEVHTSVGGPDHPGIRRTFRWQQGELESYVIVREDSEPAPFVIDYACWAQEGHLRCENRELQASLHFEIDEEGRLVRADETLTPQTSSTTVFTYEDDRLRSVKRRTHAGTKRTQLIYNGAGDLAKLVDADSGQELARVSRDCTLTID